MKPIVDLFYLSPNPYGGWVTYTAHLMDALRKAGMEPKLYKIGRGKKSERKSRDFGYGERYTNITLESALNKRNPKLIVAAAKSFQEVTAELLAAGSALVLHDPTELKNLPPLDGVKVVVIRETSLALCPDATFIKHPYTRREKTVAELDIQNHAVSTSRIDFDKHTDIILAANRLLPDSHKVKIYGFENRLYTRFKICPAFPEWEQSKAAYPRVMDAAFTILKGAKFSVDMSLIKGDGGGTQYTTLEAWDAGAIPIIQEDWIIPGDTMQPDYNCLTVSTAEQLCDALADRPTKGEEHLQQMVENGYQCLKAHDPVLIGNQYRTLLGLEQF